MIEAHGPNMEEHPWVDPNIVWQASRDKHNKGRVRGLPGVKPRQLVDPGSSFSGTFFTQPSPTISQQQIQEAVAQEMRERMQKELEDWQRRQQQQAEIELQQRLQAVEEERRRERERNEAQIGHMQTQIENLQKQFSEHVGFLDSKSMKD